MENRNRISLVDWKLHYDDQIIPANVPGDITIDLWKAGKVKNPYVGDNYKSIEWVAKRDFEYTGTLFLKEEDLKKDVLELVFPGIDLFAEIEFNGTVLGETENMFLEYRFPILSLAKPGPNQVRVHMKSTLAKMEQYKGSPYWGCFNTERIFLRKSQCHFGWDWAPVICGYGIWQEVYAEAKSRYQIENVQIKTDADGYYSFLTELNYNVRPMIDPDGNLIAEGAGKEGDVLRYYLSEKPFGDLVFQKELPVEGKKSLFGGKKERPELWWPFPYGEQPLYRYRIELVRGGEVVSVSEGNFAFREVALQEKPNGVDRLGFTFLMNRKPIYVRGSNWVPMECFTGTEEDAKYRNLLSLAKEAGIGLVRVWGGGAYEKDLFYDLCDEYGILVWQDIMLACADIPEEDPHFVANIKKEIFYQVKRLRNHPSLIYWCGGNEKTGSYSACISHGDDFTAHLVPGWVSSLDDTRPFRNQSPFSRTDVGNDVSSGETHFNCLEALLTQGGMPAYREVLSHSKIPSFSSECASLGPSSLETMEKFLPEGHRWPMDELWKERLMDNPYAPVRMDFARREFFYAESLYGTPKNLIDFLWKGMMVQSESLRAECEYSRAHKAISSGFMNWMFDDIWPSATWATVDYYGEPKGVYYQIKRSYAPLLVSFYQNEKGETLAFVCNETSRAFTQKIQIERKTKDGQVLQSMAWDANASVGGNDEIRVPISAKKGEYLVAYYEENGQKKTTLYSPSMFANESFLSKMDYQIEKIENGWTIHIKAGSYLRYVQIHAKDNYLYRYSDNDFDLEKGAEATIFVRPLEGADPNPQFIIESYTGE